MWWIHVTRMRTWIIAKSTSYISKQQEQPTSHYHDKQTNGMFLPERHVMILCCMQIKWRTFILQLQKSWNILELYKRVTVLLFIPVDGCILGLLYSLCHLIRERNMFAHCNIIVRLGRKYTVELLYSVFYLLGYVSRYCMYFERKVCDLSYMLQS